MLDLIDFIHTKATQLGLHLVGITTPKTPTNYSNFLEWISHGYYGEMDYLVRQDTISKRENPKKLFPECKSCILVGLIYSLQRSIGITSQKLGEGWIASYARGVDYHAEITHRLKQLHEHMEKRLSSPIGRILFCDSSPILEKSMAQSAGLGWIGRNSLVISPEFGSSFNIGGLLLDFAIKPSNPFPQDFCGDCQKCVDVCPTGCIQPNRTLVANRCISYLTIEHKGVIPAEIRPSIGSWIFGCDVCQIVCPYNQTSSFQLRASTLVDRIDLIKNLSLTNADFQKYYQHTPIQRIGLNQFLRNCIIVTGNQQLTSAIPLLTYHLTNNQDHLIRGYAAWALGKMRTIKGKEVLEDHLNNENNKFVLEETRTALQI